MKTEYDLLKMKFRKNPYAAKLKKSVTMRLSEDVISYFKQMADPGKHRLKAFIKRAILFPKFSLLAVVGSQEFWGTKSGSVIRRM